MVEVGDRVSERRGGEHVVTAEAAGAPLWFASADAELATGPEAFGSALLIPALHAGHELRLAGRADRTWRANAAEAAALISEWWGYEPRPPRVATRLTRGRRRAVTALCFTGGVDSFHSLLQIDPEILLYVAGYDVPLEDERRTHDVVAMVREVARDAGARAVIVRTNLREHPLAAAVNWERSHGGALAAAGHLLSRLAGTLAISGGVNRERARPWGSHHRLDPLWSSAALRVVHAGDEVFHNDKLRALADDDLVQRHLRVCWEHRTEQLNCSRCEKCLITMAVLADHGRLERFAGFDGPEVLVERIDALHSTRYFFGWRQMLARGVEPRLGRAVERLLARSHSRAGHAHR